MIEKVLQWYAQLLPQHHGKNRLIRFADRLRFSRGTQKVNRDNITWFLDTSDHIQWHLFYYGIYEPEETRWIKQYIQPGMVVFDVGANIGYYSVIMSKLIGPNGMIHSFEAATAAFNRLKEHINVNHCKNTIIYHSAISDRNGQCIIYCADNANTGESSLKSFDGFKKKETVSCFTLDSYIEKKNINKVDFIKVDVEGAEMLVIDGAMSLLKRHRPTIMLEINPSYLFRMGANTDNLILTMKHAGYNMYCFDQGILKPCDNKNVALKGKVNANVVFIPQKH
jgi:FkbM family methyltransferase